MTARLLKVVICIVFTTLLSCTSFFNNAIDNVNDSLETSNKAFVDSNIKIHGYIKSNKVRDTNKNLMADSLLYASDEANELIDKFKEEISNLKLVGRGNEHAQALFASSFTFTPLIGVVSNVDTRTSMVMNNSSRKLKLDSILTKVRSLYTDSLWRKKNIEGANVNSVLMILSGIQMSCSNATNLALSELQQQSLQYPQSRPSL